MEPVDYKTVYDRAIRQLSELVEKRERLEVEQDLISQEIELVRQLVVAVSPLCAADPYVEHPDLLPASNVPSASSSDLGFTDAIRRVLIVTTPGWISPVQVRWGLSRVGYEIKSKNILPSIHTVLKRLEEKKEVESKIEDKRMLYRWKLPPGTQKELPKFAKPIDWIKFLEGNVGVPRIHSKKSTRKR